MEIKLIANRKLYDIATDIKTSWPELKNNPTAETYVNAMTRLEAISDPYGTSTGKRVVQYFLANASSYTGSAAKRIKKELSKMVRK